MRKLLLDIIHDPKTAVAIGAALLAFISGVLGPRVQLRIGSKQAAAAQRANDLTGTRAIVGCATAYSRNRGKAKALEMLTLRMLYFEDLSVGMTEMLSKVIDASDVVGFAEVTGDRNPIHLSEHFAAKTPFGTRIAHGLYTASLISAVLGTRLPGPGAVYISQTLNFRAPVKIGDTVDVSVAVAELVPEKFRARLTCRCSVGEEVVLDGEAWVKVPSKQSGGRPLPRI